MKLKSLCVFLLAFCSMNAFADVQLQNAQWVNHEEWTNQPLPNLLHSKTIVGSPQVVTTSASAEHDYGYANSNSNAFGVLGFDITNRTKSTETIYVDRYICINNTSCTHVRDTYNVNPDGHLYDYGSRIFTTMYFSKQGNYQTQCVIDITGSERSSAHSYGTLTIL